MEIVVIIIMLLVIFSLLLKMTYMPVYGRLTISSLLALSIGLSWEYAANQSKTQIAEWLQNPELMLDIAVLLTIDVFIQVSFCILDAKFMSGEKMTKTGNILRVAALWLPGILIFPTLFSGLVEVIFSFPGMDFGALAWTLAAAIFLASISLPVLIKCVIPEKDLRLELIFMVNALIAILGVIATVNGRTAVAGTDNIEWQTLLGVLSLLIVGAAAGFLIFKRNNNKKLSHIQ